jgi:hypothetical protein
MSLAHKYSSPTIRSDVDLFSVPSTCTTIEDSFYAEYKPTVNVQDSNAKIEFRIVGSNHYVDLHDHFLYIKAKITDNKGADPVSTDKYSVANYLLHTMFSQVDVHMNNQIVSSSNCYGHKAYLQTLLSYGPDYLNTQAQSAMFYKDVAKGTSQSRERGTSRVARIVSRKNYVKLSSEFEMCD